MNRLVQTSILAVLFSLSFCAQALDEQPAPASSGATTPGFHVAFSVGLTSGGDTLATAHYTDGSSASIKAGQLFQLGLGGLYQFENTPLALLLSVNYHFDKVNASNGDMSFNRVPIEVLAYYTGAERFRIGGGVRLVNSPEASVTINGTSEKVTFDNTTGIVGEVGIRVAPSSWINLRYVSEKYKANSYTATSGVTFSGTGGQSVNGSHVGIFYAYDF